MKLDQLNKHIRMMTIMVGVFAVVASIGFISAVTVMFKSQSALERSLYQRPVMVVPGAVAGEYVAGLSEENIKGVARYVSGLGVTFTPANFSSRMQELLTYSATSYLPELTNMVNQLSNEVIAQSQGRYFVADSASERITVIGGNSYEYTAKGAWVFTAAGLPLSTDLGMVTIRFELGQPSEKNRYGLQLQRLLTNRQKSDIK